MLPSEQRTSGGNQNGGLGKKKKRREGKARWVWGGRKSRPRVRGTTVEDTRQINSLIRPTSKGLVEIILRLSCVPKSCPCFGTITRGRSRPRGPPRARKDRGVRVRGPLTDISHPFPSAMAPPPSCLNVRAPSVCRSIVH